MRKPRRFVLGDLHGAYKALKQVLERAEFDYENDQLIHLGDVVDGWGQSFECVEELLKVKDLIAIAGNHDREFLKWIETSVNKWMWAQGGLNTAKSYAKAQNFPIVIKTKYEYDSFGNRNEVYTINMPPEIVPDKHRKFFKYQHRYYIDSDNNIFVHGGFNRHLPFKEQTYDDIYWWDRELFSQALSAHGRNKLKFEDTNIQEIFIGHTSTIKWGFDVPMKAGRVWNIDTGAGDGAKDSNIKGRLSLMEVDTKELYQSDFVTELYSN